MREVRHEELNGNIFKMINSDWMLITAECGGKVNTMTASWGGVGELLGKYVAFVFIRPQRYTFEFTEKTDRMPGVLKDSSSRARALAGQRDTGISRMPTSRKDLF